MERTEVTVRTKWTNTQIAVDWDRLYISVNYNSAVRHRRMLFKFQSLGELRDFMQLRRSGNRIGS